jgi:hypothetical protein
MSEALTQNAADAGVDGDTEFVEEGGTLSETDTAVLNAVITYSAASVELVAVFEEHMGKNSKDWTTNHPTLKKIRRELREYYIANVWKDEGKYGRLKAADVLGTDSTGIVETMKIEVRKKPSEFEHGSPMPIFIERMNRNYLNHFRDKVLNPAKLLHEVSAVLMTIERMHVFELRSHTSFFFMFNVYSK